MYLQSGNYTMKRMIHSYNSYLADDIQPRNAEIFYRECMKKHDGKIPPVHDNDREFICDLFLHDVKIRDKVKEFIAETPSREKLFNLF
jgi:hypothetical protein